MLPSIKMHGNLYSIALIHNVITYINIILTHVCLRRYQLVLENPKEQQSPLFITLDMI